jgi:NAD(P)-dependent dehydrogenase (short-subunit alcohol dehydrogenase family)
MGAFIVTGAASGIGLACARRLLDQGHRVAAIDIKAEALAAALGAATKTLLHLPCDVSQSAAVDSAVARAADGFGAPDGLIHCAAVHSPSFWTDLEAEEFNRVLQVNVTGSFLIAKAVARAMQAKKKGAIVLTSSANVLAGGVGGQAGMGGPAYVASKSAIVGLVRSMARSLGPDGIRVNAVMPGVTETPMIAKYSQENRAASLKQIPLGHIGTAEEIADVMCFLVSDGSRYVSGETMIVNGAAMFG